MGLLQEMPDDQLRACLGMARAFKSTLMNEQWFESMAWSAHLEQLEGEVRRRNELSRIP